MFELDIETWGCSDIGHQYYTQAVGLKQEYVGISTAEPCFAEPCCKDGNVADLSCPACAVNKKAPELSGVF